MNLEKIRELARKGKAEFINLKFVDLPGNWHHITLPVSQLGPKLFQRGVGMDGSSVSGFRKVKAGDMVCIPDPDTAFYDPFWERPTLSMIGDLVDVDAKEGFSRDPRYVAIKAERYLAKLGIAQASLWSPEFEFYLFDDVRYGESDGKSFYDVDSGEAAWNTGREECPNLGYKVKYKGGYHVGMPQDTATDLRSEMVRNLEGCGVGVKYHHHEVGGAGQQEIEVLFGSLTQMADRTMIVKHVVKNAARRHGKTATFMPKPLFNEPGSGMHVHQYLSRGGKSLFYDQRKEAHLSKLARYYIGGLLHHVRALAAFTNPSTNSYKRLVLGFEAPVKVFYSVGNRAAAIRIPRYATAPESLRLEYRPPDATANPYLAYAGMLMAGIDGIRKKLDPGPPKEGDVFSLPEKEFKRIPTLPLSLEEALDELERDQEFLKAGDVFTEDLIQAWLSFKRREAEEVRIRIHPHEYALYYDC